jgi:UDP-N-acetyl-2-amino-2-deoxyglucuronate dehydrogenase
MLTWIFGNVKQNVVHVHDKEKAAGYFELERARVRWFLSVDYNSIPKEIQATGARTYRSITVDGEEIEFSGGFTDLHTRSYEHILSGKGFGLEEAGKSIEIVHDIRSKEIVTVGEKHPLITRINTNK